MKPSPGQLSNTAPYMPPKRKAQAQAADSDEYESEDDAPLSDQEDIQRLIDKYDVVGQSKRNRAAHVIDAASHLFKLCDQWDAKLKLDHTSRPVWVRLSLDLKGVR